jgi:hypothetical protein
MKSVERKKCTGAPVNFGAEVGLGVNTEKTK